MDVRFSFSGACYALLEVMYFSNDVELSGILDGICIYHSFHVTS